MNVIQQLTAVTTSWDDGHPLDFRVAGLLEKYGFAGTFYIPRRAPQSVMLPDQIRELSRRFEIGAHTLDHFYLNRVSDPVAVQQLSGSRQWIEDLTGNICRVFCFPGGRFKTRQLPLVKAAGFIGARTVELLSIRPPAPKGSVLLIPTTIQAFPHRAAAYANNAIRRGRNLLALCRHVFFQTGNWVALAERLFLRALQSRAVFHLWGHSWEIERHNQWRNLENLLLTISRHRGELRFVTNSALCEPVLEASGPAVHQARAVSLGKPIEQPGRRI